MNYRISITSRPPRFLEKSLERDQSIWLKGLGFGDFSDEIIVYNLFSKEMPLVTFDKLLQEKCKNLEF